jgi:hypothetical protein
VRRGVFRRRPDLGLAGGGLLAAALAGSWPAEGSSWPLDPRLWGSDTTRSAPVASVSAALDTLDASRWQLVDAIVVGSLQEVRRIADARGRAMDVLSRGVTDPALLADVPWSHRTRWIEQALSGAGDWPSAAATWSELPRRGRCAGRLSIWDWLRPALRGRPEEDPAFRRGSRSLLGHRRRPVLSHRRRSAHTPSR